MAMPRLVKCDIIELSLDCSEFYLVKQRRLEIPPVELVVFLCYGRSMKETKELDQGIFKEVMKIFQQEREKIYWREVKSLNKKKKKIERNGRKKSLF